VGAALWTRRRRGAADPDSPPSPAEPTSAQQP
jgi:hypothetical protein